MLIQNCWLPSSFQGFSNAADLGILAVHVEAPVEPPRHATGKIGDAEVDPAGEHRDGLGDACDIMWRRHVCFTLRIKAYKSTQDTHTHTEDTHKGGERWRERHVFVSLNSVQGWDLASSIFFLDVWWQIALEQLTLCCLTTRCVWQEILHRYEGNLQGLRRLFSASKRHYLCLAKHLCCFGTSAPVVPTLKIHGSLRTLRGHRDRISMIGLEFWIRQRPFTKLVLAMGTWNTSIAPGDFKAKWYRDI